ncbi:unnamed protein product [Soboliphyme baturini]|uniref:TrmE-type G domain-containing protein n=1 Tax=Soboliphyme baturini TaxID=241478 RepID=A0A183IDZ2_9BILA|nr:unnamed protein product [Soboliphyme baturini]
MNSHLIRSRAGERIRNGVCVAIVGPPNAGKSSLLNAICQRQAAIVSPIPGTTRDSIEVYLRLGDYPVTIIDTAGIRETCDVIEEQGVLRSRQRAQTADILIAVFDATDPSFRDIDATTSVVNAFLNDLQLVPAENEVELPAILLVFNKCDLLPAQVLAATSEYQWRSTRLRVIQSSCLTTEGTEAVVKSVTAVAKSMCDKCFTAPMPCFTNHRHRRLVESMVEDITAGLQCEDVVIKTEKLKSALYNIGKLSGKVSVDEILDKIFSRFCIGK